MKIITLFQMFIVLALSMPVFAGRPPRADRVFTDHMVLQCDQPVPIWGKARANTDIVVVLGEYRQATQSDANGYWRVVFDPMPANSTPQTLLMTDLGLGGGDMQLNDVLVGEVWLCTGQSNMYLRMREGQVNDAKQIIQNADHPLIRMSFNHKPWQAITPQTVTNHSAVSYLTAIQLQDQLKVPIGIITLTAGGRALQTWFDLETFNADPANADIVEHWKHAPKVPKKNPLYHPFLKPGLMDQQFMKPVYGYGIRGVLWYQGEAEAARDWGKRYYRLFPQLIAIWRKTWDTPDMPFYCVQLPAYGKPTDVPGKPSAWADVRDAQALKLPHTGYAVTYDGRDTDLHPKDKKLIADRLARLVLQDYYYKNVVGISPSIQKVTRNGDQLKVTFNDLPSGLKADSDSVRGFAIGNDQGQWVWANARIAGKTILIDTDQMSDATTLRYAWADNPQANLMSREDLPVAPYQGKIQ